MANADWWHDKAQDLDAPHAKVILDAYKSAFATGIQPALESLKSKIEAYETRTGKTAPQSWLLDQDRLRQLNYQVSNKLSEFKGIVAGEVKESKSQAVDLATKASGDLLGSFSSMPPGVVEEIVGTSAYPDDTPLGQLLSTFAPDAQAGIKKELINHAVLGRSPDETAKAIQHQLGIPLTRALTMVRTETARAYTNASLETYRQNPSMVWGWRWLTAEDDKVCEYCGPLDQSVHTLEDDMETHPNCRCAMAPITMDEAINEGLDQIDLSEFDPDEEEGLFGDEEPEEEPEEIQEQPEEVVPEPEPVATPLAPLRFGSTTEAKQWAEAFWAVHSDLTPEQLEAVRNYTGAGYGRINGHLRGTRPATDEAEMDQRIGLIDQALAAKPVPEAVTVYRGVGMSAFGGNMDTVAPGMVFNEPGYMSTAVGTGLASGFQDKPVQITMNVPAGTPGRYLEAISKVKGEREVLLARNLDYMVTSSRYNSRKGKWEVEVDVLPRGSK